MMTIIRCTNGNSNNGIKGSRVRWYCKKCGKAVAEHLSPQRGPAGYYERKHPAGKIAEDYRAMDGTARIHEEQCRDS